MNIGALLQSRLYICQVAVLGCTDKLLIEFQLSSFLFSMLKFCTFGGYQLGVIFLKPLHDTFAPIYRVRIISLCRKKSFLRCVCRAQGRPQFQQAEKDAVVTFVNTKTQRQVSHCWHVCPAFCQDVDNFNYLLLCYVFLRMNEQ